MQLNVSQAKRARDALIKTLYTDLHNMIVQQINSRIAPNLLDVCDRYIGILDIPGFGMNYFLDQTLLYHFT